MMIQIEDGWIEIGDDKGREPRLYTGRDGELFPSVTTVLGVFENTHITKWRGRIGNEAADYLTNEAGEFGDGIHDYTAVVDIVREIPFTPPPALEEYIRKYYMLITQHVEKVVAVEKVVMSYRWGFAGRVDRVFRLKNEELNSLWDIKTGTIKKLHRAQTAAYTMAWEEQEGDRIGRRGLIEVSRRSKRVRFVPHDEDDSAGWLALLDAYKWLRKIGEVG